jgi:hypothetical protein
MRSGRPIGRVDSGATLSRCYCAPFTPGKLFVGVSSRPRVAVLCLAGCGMRYCLGSVWSEVVGVAALEQAVDRGGGGQAELGSSSLQVEINYGEGRDTRRTSGGHTSSMGWDVEIATEDDKLLRTAHGEGPMEGGSESEPDLT